MQRDRFIATQASNLTIPYIPVHGYCPLPYTTDTGGPSWNRRIYWMDSGDPCTWSYEVHCNDAQDVVVLEFFDNNMQGQLPTEFGDLTTLTSGGYGLFGENKLSGTLPTEIGRLSAMVDGM